MNPASRPGKYYDRFMRARLAATNERRATPSSAVGQGRICAEDGCTQVAGTAWGPYWCPQHDDERIDRIARQMLVNERPENAAGECSVRALLIGIDGEPHCTLPSGHEGPHSWQPPDGWMDSAENRGQQGS